MLVKPPYYSQETEYSCLAACLRMVLESRGVIKSEKELRILTDCDFDSGHYPGGATAQRIVDAARLLGFPNSSKNNLVLPELVAVVLEGLFPIVLIGIRLQPDEPVQSHAVVVTAISNRGVTVLDPNRGELIEPQRGFDEM